MAHLKYAGNGVASTTTKAGVQSSPHAAANSRPRQDDASGGQRPRPGGHVNWAPSSQVLWISSPLGKLRAAEHS